MKLEEQRRQHEKEKSLVECTYCCRKTRLNAAGTLRPPPTLLGFVGLGWEEGAASALSEERKKIVGVVKGGGVGVAAPLAAGIRKEGGGEEEESRVRGKGICCGGARLREEVKGGEYLYIYVRENYNKLPYYSFLIIFLTQKFIYIIVLISFLHNII